YGAEVERQRADRLVSGRVIAGEAVATYFHTGGTTGAPKLAQQTHWNQVCMAWITAHILDCGPGDRFLVGLPLFHANAAIASGLNVLGCGGTIVLAGQNGFRDPATMGDFWRIVDRHKITAFSAVPTILANLLDLPRDGCDVSSLRICLCGAAPLAVSLFRAFEAATGLKILEAYGMTESTLCSTINPRDGERRIGSVGIRVPYHQVKTALLDADGGFVRDCEDEEVGVLLLKGDTVTPGYKQPQFNKGLWPQPGWLNSGDLARRDADGYFWLTGRAKDLIIRGGHNIDPAVIEEALHRHPAVELAAAVGRPDPRVGEVPVAFVSLRPGMSADPEDLRDFARANVPERPAAPAYVRIIGKIPTTAVGKIFKPALREIVIRETVEQALAEAALGEITQVSVASDKTRGIVARIALDLPAGASPEGARAKVETALLRYPITLDIVAAEPAQ
ncbi:MAG TPA: AMP-binding protein, partial [Phenylobacterium sp.]|nr:AMP-binding protein [Phenylobacterium sp.]